MSLFDELFGPAASAIVLGTANSQAQQNQASWAQLGAQYTQAQQRRFVSHTWVFNGKPCTLHEFANAIWPEDHEDKMLFILTHSGPNK